MCGHVTGSRLTATLSAILFWTATAFCTPAVTRAADTFEGEFYSGQGDLEYLRLLDCSRRMFSPDPEFQNIAMLYTPDWNGFVEGPTWGAWWIQNSYGPTYCGLPLFEEPLATFLQNSQDLWFDQMGDGQRTWTHGGKELVVPDGQLCDAASPDWFVPKQGDGNVAIHDWGIEFTAAGLLMQSELLLISRDEQAIAHYLPRLRRCANFIESRRDPTNNLFLVGPAGNLLAPSYAGWRKPDGTRDKAYLAGLSITYIAALDRLIELEKLAGNPEAVQLLTARRDLARKGLPLLTTDEGYFIKSLDPDGTRHGVHGADRHGYFEAVPNHDAICFRVVDDRQAEQIYQKIDSIPGLRPHDLIITNCPGLDDMYTPPTTWLWKFGTWVNGGHWSTCEARMVMGYYRLGKYGDARRSMQQLMKFAREFRMDNPLVDFGARVYQPAQPINLCYDSFGPPAAMIRGLFEYLYHADRLVLLPHVPSGITRLEQHFPIRFGRKRLYFGTNGSGPVTSVLVNGQPWPSFDEESITLPYVKTPQKAVIQIAMGGVKPARFVPRKPASELPDVPELSKITWSREQFPVISTNKLPLRIGADSRAGSRFLGRIGRVRVFSRPMTTEEIGDLARNSAGALDKDETLVGDWKLDVVRDNVFSNLANEDLPAKAVGSFKIVDGSSPAVKLSGQGYLEVAHDPRLDLADGCTLDALICPKQQASSGGRILDKSEVGTGNGYLLDTHPGNSLRLITERGVLTYDAKLEPDVWVHVAATVDAEGGLALYIDGKQVACKKEEIAPRLVEIDTRIARIRVFHQRLVSAGLADSYEAAHARLAVDYLAATYKRLDMLSRGKLERLSGQSQYAADKSYFSTVAKLCEGLERTASSYEGSEDAHHKRVHAIWSAVEFLPETACSEDLSTRPGQTGDEDFVSVFDGETLDGWHAVPEECASDWSVQDGVIVGRGSADRLSYLVWKDNHLTDFELRFRYRLPGKGNTGVEIRSQPDASGKRPFEGYHADLGHVGIGPHILGAWDFHFAQRKEFPCHRGIRLVIDEDGQPHSSAVHGALTAADVRQHQWNNVRIIARGTHFQFFINDKLASEFADNSRLGRLDHGAIGLQIHDKGMRVEFADIRLRRLAATGQSLVPVNMARHRPG